VWSLCGRILVGCPRLREVNKGVPHGEDERLLELSVPLPNGTPLIDLPALDTSRQRNFPEQPHNNPRTRLLLSAQMLDHPPLDPAFRSFLVSNKYTTYEIHSLDTALLPHELRDTGNCCYLNTSSPVDAYREGNFLEVNVSSATVFFTIFLTYGADYLSSQCSFDRRALPIYRAVCTNFPFS
jgi:hypothetical protein